MSWKGWRRLCRAELLLTAGLLAGSWNFVWQTWRGHSCLPRRDSVSALLLHVPLRSTSPARLTIPIVHCRFKILTEKAPRRFSARQARVPALHSSQNFTDGTFSAPAVVLKYASFLWNPYNPAAMLLGNSAISVLYFCTASLYFRRSTLMRFSVPLSSSCNRMKFSFERNCG